MADPDPEHEPSDLEVLRARLQVVMMDVNAKSWDTTTLDESLRLALMDIGCFAGAQLTIAGLAGPASGAGASITTLEDEDQGALIIGASAYAARSRALDLTEKVSTGQGTQAGLADYARSQMALFQDRLELIKERVLHEATTPPHSALTWNEEPPNF